MRKRLTILAALGLCSPALALECTVTSTYRCDGAKCVSGSTALRINVDSGKQTVFRCDAKGCDTIPVEIFASGVMVNYVSGKNGYMFRHNTTDDTFLEVATSMNLAYIKHGVCKR